MDLIRPIVKTYNNYQVMDTGYREQNSDKRKRYREIQFKLNNTSQRTLRFQSEFYIDGELRRGMYRYIVQHNIDPDSPDYGLIYIERVLLDPSIVPEVLPPTAPGATILGGGTEGDHRTGYVFIPRSNFLEGTDSGIRERLHSKVCVGFQK